MYRICGIDPKRSGQDRHLDKQRGADAPHEYIYNTDERYVNTTLSTNLNGAIYGCQVASAGMIAQKGGAIYSMEGLGSNNMVQRKPSCMARQNTL